MSNSSCVQVGHPQMYAGANIEVDKNELAGWTPEKTQRKQTFVFYMHACLFLYLQTYIRTYRRFFTRLQTIMDETDEREFVYIHIICI